MPNCPICGDTLGMCEFGFICYKTLDMYNWFEAKHFEGYDFATVENAKRLFLTLINAGLLGPGANRVEFLEDGMLIERLNLPD